MSAPDPTPIDLASQPDFGLGPHHVSPSTREIAGAGTSVTLEPRVMQVLVALAERRGQTVSRDYLIARCWAGVVVGEDSIQRCIARLRKTADALGGFAIETLTRVGYRLHEGRRSAANVQVEPRGSSPLLAVLPFDNLSEDPGLAYLADGVAEDILHTIARTSTIAAVGRTSSFQFRGAAKVVAQIGATLGVSHILDGSVRRAGPRVRVSAHLMEVGDQTMLWSDRFDGLVEDRFALQDQVAAAVVGVLRGTFHASRDSRPADRESLEASDVAMRIRDLIGTPTFLRDHGGRELLARLESTVSPQSADAWALIATAQAALRWTADGADESRLRQQARAAAERALAIDPWCGEAHKALYLLEPPAGTFAAIETRLLRACETVPTNGEIHWALFQLSLAMGRIDAAATHAEVAYRVDPLRPPNVTAYAVSLHAADQIAFALDLLEDAVERWPDDPSVLAIAAWGAATVADMERVDRLLVRHQPDRYSAAAKASTERVFLTVRAYRNPESQARNLLLDRFNQDAADGRPRFSVMAACANLEADVEALYAAISPGALESLHRPEARLGLLDGLAHLFLPVNRRLRESPRFVELCRGLGLVDYWKTTGRWPDCAGELEQRYGFKRLVQSGVGLRMASTTTTSNGARDDSSLSPS